MNVDMLSILVDSDHAAVELRTTGLANSGKPLDDVSCWIIKAEGGVITEGKLARLDAASSQRSS